MEWNLAEAQSRLSDVMQLALTEGPQRIRRRKDAVVVISAAEFERLANQQPSFKDYLAKGESFEGLDLERDPSPSRSSSL